MKTTYHRMVCGTSAINILISVLSAFFQPLTYPITEPSAVCTADGFWNVFSFASLLYNASLSCHYLLVINYNVPNTRLTKIYEPMFPAISMLWSLSSSMIIMPMGSFAPFRTKLGCELSEFPRSCKEDEDLDCQVEYNSWLFLDANNRYAYELAPSSDPGTLCTTSRSGCRPYIKPRGSSSQSSKVAVQIMLYLAAFLGSYITGIVVLIVAETNEDNFIKGRYYRLSAHGVFLFPVQGCFVSFQPRYSRWGMYNKEKSRFFSVRRAIFTMDNPRIRGIRSSFDGVQTDSGGFRSKSSFQTEAEI